MRAWWKSFQVRTEQAQAVLDGLARRAQSPRRLAHRHLRYEVDEDLVLEGWLAQAVVEPKALRGEAPAAGAALEALDDAAVTAAREEAAAAPGERGTGDERGTIGLRAARRLEGHGQAPAGSMETSASLTTLGMRDGRRISGAFPAARRKS
jgi:hypothetical protein